MLWSSMSKIDLSIFAYTKMIMTPVVLTSRGML